MSSTTLIPRSRSCRNSRAGVTWSTTTRETSFGKWLGERHHPPREEQLSGAVAAWTSPAACGNFVMPIAVNDEGFTLTRVPRWADLEREVPDPGQQLDDTMVGRDERQPQLVLDRRVPVPLLVVPQGLVQQLVRPRQLQGLPPREGQAIWGSGPRMPAPALSCTLRAQTTSAVRGERIRVWLSATVQALQAAMGLRPGAGPGQWLRSGRGQWPHYRPGLGRGSTTRGVRAVARP